ncbi:hypothetical protein EON73_02945 [bacterium]|nr:MAG: hypothetical protein EON73_02945 [bacterium]
MQTRVKENQPDQYLLCSYCIPDNLLETIKVDIKRFMSDREKDDNYYKFIDWQKKENELVVLTMYVYEDMKLPKTFDTIFQIGNPDNFVQINFSLTQAVINGWTPIDHISRGHKHICVIEFSKEIPDIFNLIPLFNKQETSQKTNQIGFCDSNTFESARMMQ